MRDRDGASADLLLEGLCNLLDDELERQEAALGLCQAQREGIRSRDAVGLDANTAALNAVITESSRASQSRTQLLKKVAERCGLSPERPTVSALVDVVAEPWRTRLDELQERMRSVLAETRAVVRENAHLLRVSTGIIESALRAFDGLVRDEVEKYTEHGGAARRETREPALLDQRG